MENTIQVQSEQFKTGRKTISSEGLLEGRREVIILHKGHEYRLQMTKAGKLILNK